MCYKYKRENSTQCFHALLRSHLSGKGGGEEEINLEIQVKRHTVRIQETIRQHSEDRRRV